MVLTFSKVFTAEGEKNGKTWKRWDFKTEDGQRYVTFSPQIANSVNTGQPYEVEIEGDNKIQCVKPVGGPESAGNQQASSGSSGGSQAVRSDPVASGGYPKRDFKVEAIGKTKCALWAAILPAMFSSLPQEEQTVENAGHLVHHALTEVFPDDLPPF